MALSQKRRHDKLTRLAQLTGYPNKESLLHIYVSEVQVPGICTNLGCDYYQSVDRDQHAAFCPNCKTRTVQSALVIAGLV